MLINKKKLCLCGVLTAAVQLTSFANINFVITETALGVELTGSGSVNTTGLTEIQTPTEVALTGGFIIDFHDGLSVGTGAIDFFDPLAFIGPDAFGPGIANGFAGATATSGAGDAFGFDLYQLFLVVPEGYSSGDVLSGSGFYAGATLESLDLTAGSFSWTDQGGNNTINVTIVPEPSHYALLVGAAALSLLVIQRRGGSRA